MEQHGFGEIAVRVEQCESGAGSEVLHDQVQQQCRFAGAGLADEVEMPPPLLARVRPNRPRCGCREEAPVVRLSWAERSRCAVRIAIWNDAGSSRSMRSAEAVGRRSPRCIDGLGCRTPAHCRLASGHDPCGMAANLIVPRWMARCCDKRFTARDSTNPFASAKILSTNSISITSLSSGETGKQHVQSRQIARFAAAKFAASVTACPHIVALTGTKAGLQSSANQGARVPKDYGGGSG